jgi:hypothetical protein
LPTSGPHICFEESNVVGESFYLRELRETIRRLYELMNPGIQAQAQELSRILGGTDQFRATFASLTPILSTTEESLALRSQALAAQFPSALEVNQALAGVLSEQFRPELVTQAQQVWRSIAAANQTSLAEAIELLRQQHLGEMFRFTALAHESVNSIWPRCDGLSWPHGHVSNPDVGEAAWRRLRAAQGQND